MYRKPVALLLSAVFTVCAIAAGADAAPTPVPDAKRDLSSMAFLVGSWTCESVLRGSKRPNATTFTMDYEGHWLKGHDVAPAFDKYRKRALTTDTWTGYNAVKRLWVQTSVDDFGGYGISTSPGWKGKKITFTTVVTPDGSSGVDTLTKVSDTETSDTFVGKDKNGKPQPTQTTVCKKG